MSVIDIIAVPTVLSTGTPTATEDVLPIVKRMGLIKEE